MEIYTKDGVVWFLETKEANGSFEVMHWCNVLKLAVHWNAMHPLYASTGDKEAGDGPLVGHNHLGKVLTRIRDEVVERPELVLPPAIPDLLIFGEPVRSIRVYEDQPSLFGS